MTEELQRKGAAAREAAYQLAAVTTETKNQALLAIADALEARAEEILEANAKDVAAAKENGTRQAMIDRLTLTQARIAGMAEGVRQVAALADPIGQTVKSWTRPNGLEIAQRRVPMGVIAIIFEARPNVTVDAAVLCLKTSNAVILRGGKEAIHSNLALMRVMQDAAYGAGIPAGSLDVIADTSRETATQLMKMNGYIDLLIPRGGAGLIRAVVENATVPVIETAAGNCHVYVDGDCDPDMALKIILNAKVSRPSVCNAAETLLIDRRIADTFLPLAVKLVDGVEDAIRHINRYNTKHSEAIVTENTAAAEKFLNEVDAAAVYVNASTRFTDGFEFGFGAEIGISTQKMHARGPMGLEQLTSIKYVIHGHGQIRE